MTILGYIAAGLFYAALLAVTLAMSTYLGWFTADAKRDAEADKQDKLKREMQAATLQAIARELDNNSSQIDAGAHQAPPYKCSGRDQ